MPESGFRRNQLGLVGWLSGGRYGIERYAFTLHRLTGLAILAYFLLHILVGSSRMLGEETWNSVMERLDSPVFRYGEFLVYLAFAFHALNGLRLALTELGFFLGAPRQPVFPYTSSVRRQRPLFVLVMIVAAVVVVLGGYDFFFAHPVK
ncbi:MAG: succinate dehydrogenase, cytochrome b556 subunit [Candidatus Eiseniibacteriota bacterium]|nr:MAG: succinate dehydrogenase, cytochrome b556 subunit [Candidatus Eisenbacteria bacterium]